MYEYRYGASKELWDLDTKYWTIQVNKMREQNHQTN